MGDGTLPSGLRLDLIRFARDKRRRLVKHNDKYPSPWHPTGLTNPTTREVFTDAGAWEWVADQLEAGVEVWSAELDHPPGKIGWYFTVPSAYPPDEIYVKVQACGDHVRGRSFHPSEKQKK